MASQTITVDTRGLEARFKRLKQVEIPSAIRNTLNDLAKDNWQNMKAKIPEVFDRPVPAVKNLPKYVKTDNKELQSKLLVTGLGSGGRKAAASIALFPHVPGEPDTRNPKGLEPRLRAKGLLGKNEWLVPTQFMVRDSYGNPKASEVGKMIADMQAYSAGPRAGRSRDARNTRLDKYAKRKGAGLYIWMRNKRTGQGGVAMRKGSALLPMFVITREPRYKKIFDPYKIVRQYTSHARVAYHADRAIAQAIRRR